MRVTVNTVKHHIHNSIPDMPVYFWAVVPVKGPAIGGFPSAVAAKVFAEEWYAGKCCVVPIVPIEEATGALAAYELSKERQGR